jgi:putative acetyltransferase
MSISAQLSIRPYDSADWPAIADIHDRARWIELELTVGQAAFRTVEQTAEGEGLFDGQLWVAEADGKLAGFVALDGAEITWLYVHPDLARRGVGRALLMHALAQCPGSAETSVLDGNEPALTLYLSEGFRMVETRDGRLAGLEEIPARGHILRRP